MQFELLKDLPGIPAGVTSEEIKNDPKLGSFLPVRHKFSHNENVKIVDEEEMRKFPDFYRPVPIVLWTPRDGEQYFFLKDGGNIAEETFSQSVDPVPPQIASGDVFRTREKAEELSRRIKKLTAEYHEEIGE